MQHFFITNRAIVKRNGKEYVNEDGSESAGENMRCGIFDSKAYKKNNKPSLSISLFRDFKAEDRHEATYNQPPSPYNISDLANPGQLVGSARLFTEMYNAMSGPAGGDLLFFIHGYQNDLPDVLETVCTLEKKYIHARSPIKHIIFFTWPAMKKVLRYRSDAKDAELSGLTLARYYLMLIDFFRAMFLKAPGTDIKPLDPCGNNIHLLAHSMGNRVLENMLIELSRQKGENITALFREVVMASADVDWQSFEQHRPFYNLINICQRATVYFHTRDVALLVSETTKNAYNRLGKFGFRDFHKIPSHVYSVDCTGIEDQKEVFDDMVNHAYYTESKKVVQDILQVLSGINAEDFVGKTRRSIPGNAAQYRLNT